MSKKELGHFDALVDTSSVVAHDLCAQLHVLQFCTEELEGHVTGEGKKYLEKVTESSQYLANLINSFRNQLKFDFGPNKKYNVAQINTFVHELLKNHFYGAIDKIELDVNESSHGHVPQGESVDNVHLLFSIYSTVIDILKGKNYFVKDKLSIELSTNEEGISMTFSGNQLDFSVEDVEKEMRVLTPDKGHIRKYLGVQYLNSLKKVNTDVLTMDMSSSLLSVTLKMDFE